MSSTRALVVLLISPLLLIAVTADAQVVVSVDASPLSVPADGKSGSRVLVTVLDGAGAPVSDGTAVHLSTSAGDITPVVYTSGGRATGILTASELPQIATINAIAEGVSGSVQVEFSSSSDYEEAAAAARTIRMTGGSLAYSVEKDVVVGSSGVTIEYKGLTIQANGAQVRQRSGRILAEGEVSVRRDEKTLTADAITCDIRDDRIRLLDWGDQSAVRTFGVRNLESVGAENASPPDRGFAPLANVDGRTWIVSERLVLIPGEKILFFKAAIYVGDLKVITLPYYSYSYSRRESILQQVRYTSSEGILVDLPLYYQMSHAGTGALKLRYAANGAETGGYFRPPRGLSLGLEQNYWVGDRNQGRVFIDSVAGPSRAFEVAHHLEFGSAATGGRADISARYQPSSSYAKNIYNTTLNVVGRLRNYNYSLSGYFGGSSIRQYDYLDAESVSYLNQSNSTFRAVFRPESPLAWRGLGKVTPSLTLGYGNLRTSSGEATSSCLYQTLALQSRRSNPGGGKTNVSFAGKTALTVATTGDAGASLRVGPTLSNRWLGGNASVSYTVNLQSGATDSVLGRAKHQLRCNLFLYSGGKWSSISSVDYGLDSGRLSLFSTLNYRPGKQWRIRCSYNLYGYAYELNGLPYRYTTSYLKAGIYRPLGPYEIGLAWSPDGQNYGTGTDQRFWLELSGRRF